MGKNMMRAVLFLAGMMLVLGAQSLLAQPPMEPMSVAEGATPLMPEGRTTLWTVLMHGGWAMVPLLLLSVFTVAFVVYCFLSLRVQSIVTSDFLSAVNAYLRKQDYLGLVAHSTRQAEALARVVQKTMEFAVENPQAKFNLLKEIAETEGGRQASKLYQQVSYLYDIGIIAPMVGLAGTVTGMITSFNVIGVDPGAMRPAMLANGVAEALIATAGGLVVGIPSMVFYSFFKGRVQHLVSELEAQATNLLAQLEMLHPHE
jgi:biopolymer transport protein ExbB